MGIHTADKSYALAQICIVTTTRKTRSVKQAKQNYHITITLSDTEKDTHKHTHTCHKDLSMDRKTETEQHHTEGQAILYSKQ